MFAKAFKSEFYRIGRMKSTYILIAVLAAIVLIVNFLYLKVDMYGLMGFSKEDIEDLQEMGTSAESYEDSFMTGFQAGLQSSEEIAEGDTTIHLLGEGILYDESVATLYTMDVGSMYELLLISIFVGLYIGSVYSTGLDKNLNNFAGRRGLLFAVRMLHIAIYSFVMHVFTWIFCLITTAMMARSVRLEIDKAFILYFLVTWLLCVAFGWIVAGMAHMTRSKAAGITLGIILSAGLLSTLISVASLMMQKRFDLGTDFNLGYYTVTHNVAALSLYSDGHFVVRAIICALVYGGLSYIGSLLVIRKRDIA